LKRAVLLDALGTLIELEPPAPLPAAEVAYYRAHMLEGRDPRSVADLRRRCAEVAGLDVETLMALLVFRAYPEVADELRALRAAGLRLVVASNWDASLPQTLARVGLLELVDGVVTAAQCGAMKPDPAVFEAALALAGVAAADALHVGDSLTEDVAGAAAVGIEAVLVDRRGESSPGGPAGPPRGPTTLSSLTGVANLARR
jgi:putative hydrolase of the HAD superfamily